MFGPLKIAKPRVCPHERIEQCPLYVESHTGSGHGCVNDALTECDVTLGKMNYAAELKRIRRH